MSAPHPIIAQLAAARRAADIPIGVIARRVGYAEGTLRHWEKGYSVPDLDGADAYAQALGYDLTLTPRTEEK